MSWISPTDEATAYHIPHMKYDKPTKWLGEQELITANGITVPADVIVDPVGNSAWIHEGNSWKHQETADRGRGYDSRDVQSLLASVTAMPGKSSFTMTLPSASELLNSNERFQSRASAYLPQRRDEREQDCMHKDLVDAGHRSLWDTKQQHLLAWRGAEPSAATVANYGKMPLLPFMHDRNEFPDKPEDEIQREILATQQRVYNRSVERGGPTDYGRVLPADDQRPYPAPRPVISLSDIAPLEKDAGYTEEQLYALGKLPGVVAPPTIRDAGVTMNPTERQAREFFTKQMVTDSYGKESMVDQDTELRKLFMEAGPVATSISYN